MGRAGAAGSSGGCRLLAEPQQGGGHSEAGLGSFSEAQ